MIKIDFKNKKIDFWRAIVFSIQKKIPIYPILKQAFDQKVLFDKNEKMLHQFIESFKNLKNQPQSQIFQDIFALFVINENFDKTFLEFGATDGFNLSNTFMLEKSGWSGVLAEPDTQWLEALKKNRPNSKIIPKCIWKKSGHKLNFFSSKQGVLSTLEDFRFSDAVSMPDNSKTRNEKGNTISVETISLNDVIKEHFKGICPSYISIDTEGSEFEILNSLNLLKYRPAVFTIEHNFTKLEILIDKLMTKYSYVRVFDKLTYFDAWYISKETLDKIK